ncbi:unannotated protein [freshwater metagenome]|uniref:Unannotated protein n=1 Tax=freshwater metagenome TaxID=449393 RepID=A0A6J6FSD9_9ZZZZ
MSPRRLWFNGRKSGTLDQVRFLRLRLYRLKARGASQCLEALAPVDLVRGSVAPKVARQHPKTLLRLPVKRWRTQVMGQRLKVQARLHPQRKSVSATIKRAVGQIFVKTTEPMLMSLSAAEVVSAMGVRSVVTLWRCKCVRTLPRWQSWKGAA